MDRLFTESELAELWHISRSTLAHWRVNRRRGKGEQGPPYTMVADLPRYLESDASNWIAAQRVAVEGQKPARRRRKTSQ